MPERSLTNVPALIALKPVEDSAGAASDLPPDLPPELPCEPYDGDWCIVDLAADIPFQATRVAHALGLDFHAFMLQALEEKLLRLHPDPTLAARLPQVQWLPLLACDE